MTLTHEVRGSLAKCLAMENLIVATQNDLVELLGKGVKVEHARAQNMELDLEVAK